MDRPLRVLHIITSLDPQTGGTAEAVRLLGNAQAAEGWTVHAVCTDKQLKLDGGFNFAVTCFDANNFYGYSRELKEWVESHLGEFDFAVIHGLWQYPMQLADASIRGKLPYFVYPHGMLDPYFNENSPLKTLKKKVYWYLLGRRMLNGADGVIFTTQDEMERSRTSFSGVKWKELIGPLGVEEPPPGLDEIAAVELPKRFPDLMTKPYHLFLSRLHSKKGCDLLLRAFAMFGKQGESLVMAGPASESYLAELKQMARELGIEQRVLWPGMVTGNTKLALLRKAQTFVLPSHQENFGVAVVEALSTSTPVLVSDQVQIAGAISDDGGGIVAPDTYEGACQLFERWNAMGDEQRMQMRHKAYQCYLDRYTVRRNMDLIMQKMQAALQRKRPGSSAAMSDAHHNVA